MIRLASEVWYCKLTAAIGALALALGTTGTTLAQDEGSTDSSVQADPQPVTTADPEVSVEHLELLLKPLTAEELVIEADGWRDLLQANVKEIADVRIGVQQEVAAIDEAAQAESEADPDAAAGAEADATSDQAAADERKAQLAEQLPLLQEEKTQLARRLAAVLDELEAKGGEVESYRMYMNSLTGVAVEVSDATSLVTLARGWLVSEEGGLRWMWNLIKFLLILVAFYFAASIVSNLVRRAVSRIKGVSQLLVNFLSKFVKQAMMVIGLIVSLAALEVNIGPMLAAVGAAGFVIGFALQNTLSNFASGLMILAYRPFDVGDVIEAAGIAGVVDSVSLFSTHVRTFDNKMMIVPNNDIWGGTITNATASDTRRVDLKFGIGYDDDVARAKEILESLVNQHELVLKDPAPVVRLNELGDSSLNFICRPWTKTSDYWAVYWDITRQVKEEFDRAGISIPFPQRDVHIYQETAAS